MSSNFPHYLFFASDCRLCPAHLKTSPISVNVQSMMSFADLLSALVIVHTAPAGNLIDSGQVKYNEVYVQVCEMPAKLHLNWS